MSSNGEPNQLGKPIYTLPGVLNFLQQDWRRFEKERNEWQVERSELRSRLAFLEGERKAMEALKSDLVKRVKMLEITLKQERAKNRDKGSDVLASSDSVVNLQARKASTGNEVVDAVISNSATRGFSHSRSKEMLRNYLKVADSLLAAAKISNQGLSQSDDQSVPRSKFERFNDPQLQLKESVGSMRSRSPESEVTASLDVGNSSGNFDTLLSSNTIKADRRRSRNSKVSIDKSNKSSEVHASIQTESIPPLEENESYIVRKVQGKDYLSSNNNNWIPDPPLRSHYDTVRSVAFHHENSILLSGSDDRTVKLWKISHSANPSRGEESKLIYTYRGHTSAVTSVAISSIHDVCFSASLDSCIIVWALLPESQPAYSPHDTSSKIHTLIGHSDAIWDIQSHSTLPMLLSCSADGSLKLWNVTQSQYSLKSTFWYDGTSNVSSEYESPTSICWGDNNSIISAYRNSVVKVFDVNTRQNTLTPESNSTFDRTSNTQINKVIYHPAMPLIITAHQDGEIRLFDLYTGKVTSTIAAHNSGVSAISLSNDGLSLVSGGYDGELKFWDLSAQKCFQREYVHEGKGVCSIVHHNINKDLVASGGGDSCCSVYRF